MNNQIGKLQPQAVEIEEAVLGTLMLEKHAVHTVLGILKPEMFYKDASRKIFEAMKALDSKSIPVDLMTVTQSLKECGNIDKVGGVSYIMDLTDRATTASNIEYHCRIIQQKYIQREVIRICSETISKAYQDDEDIFSSIEILQTSTMQLVLQNATGDASIISDVIHSRLMDYQLGSVNGLTGITSGFPSMDRMNTGWQNSDLIILAARPGMGKTALVLNLARNAAIIGGKGVAFFSLEMSKEQLVDRMVSAESTIALDTIRKRDLNDVEFNKVTRLNELIDSKIFIDDSAALSISSLRTKCIKLKQKENIGIIIIDYLQLMQGDEKRNTNREQEISSISRGLKALAKDLDVPVIALSQLSRASESRPGGQKRPMLSDLRESGAIEQDADQVIFIFRPEYYNIMEDENGRSTIGMTEILFAKNRQGPLDTAVLRFSGRYMKFFEDDYESDPSH